MGFGIPSTTDKRKALFLDRDGVINVDTGYVHSFEEFRFQEGIFELCISAQALGYILLVVTNQAGIARGYYSESDFLKLTDWMIQAFADKKVRICKVYYCPYHPLHGVGQYKCESAERKPKPGMLLRARKEFDLDLAASVLIGDRFSDIDAARAAGVGTKILLCQEPMRTPGETDHFYVSESLDSIRRTFFSVDGDAAANQFVDCECSLSPAVHTSTHAAVGRRCSIGK